MFKVIIYCILPLFISCAVNWEDCGNPERSLIFKKLNFKSENLLIDGKNPIEAEIDFHLLDPVDKEVILSAELKRYFTILGYESSIALPCINDVGSCTNNFCYMVDSYAALASTFATQMNVPFDCLMKPGQYAGNITYPVPIEGFRPLLSLLKWAASGKYELVIRWTSGDEEIGCLSVGAEVEINA